MTPLKTYLLLPFLLLIILSSCKNESTEKHGHDHPEEAIESSEQVPQEQAVEEITYAHVPHMPRFPGCEDLEKPIERQLCATNRLNNYIQNRLRYPRVALNNKVEGTVTVEFVVRPDGLIDNMGVHNDIGYGCGETVLEIVKSMNFMGERWIPGYKDGQAVRV